MRTALAGLAAAVLALSSAGCGGDAKAGSGGSGEKVRFGYIADFNGSSLLAIAAKQGLWKKQGLKPETKVFTNGPLQIQALGAGDLDAGYIGPGAFWLPASGKAKIIAINGLGFADHVIAQPGRGIRTVADLKGKKVGVPEGTSGDMILSLALKRAGLTAKDVKKVAMDPTTIVSAFASGQIDAAGIWYPLIDTIKQRKPDLVDLAGDRDFYPAMSFPNAFVSASDLPSRKPELVTKLDRVLQEAADYRAAHLDETVKLTAAFMKLPVDKVKADAANGEYPSTADLVAKTQDGTVAKWLDGLSALFAESGKLKSVPKADTYYAGDLYAKAAGK
ncbi:aliphatic sulfonate ABC transporter substrate-binding protein [Actinomadura sp. NPDC048394]|jgi:NitT/TauT family transport system substrate-binding protein|uniref:aliphatic sulfonate ABC transporter substrate-binding protein n=1 Tax=Actinomadura sp. NPDC048394 TaxID=3158223 RepID=UPI0033D10014